MHKTISPPAGMRVVPCTGVDVGFRDILAAIGLVINARLDSDKLEETLWKLVEHKFPRAGSRLAYRDDAYEFQIPETFDAQAPPFAFTVEDHPEVYNCGTRPQIPHTFTGSKPSVIPAPGLERFFRSKTCPTSLHGFLQGNGPLLHVHVAVFDDLTFIGITFPHILFDALGASTLPV
ncbi:hypothetical protein K438DRAFT_2021337 [Mycena galopus ATCC 62051]|nr:hypothetical protein K438DRAFT_2021337 [Mycena galopus ATCC 62051]